MQSFISSFSSLTCQTKVFFFDNSYLQFLFDQGRENNSPVLISAVGWEGWAVLTKEGYNFLYGNHNIKQSSCQSSLLLIYIHIAQLNSFILKKEKCVWACLIYIMYVLCVCLYIYVYMYEQSARSVLLIVPSPYIYSLIPYIYVLLYILLSLKEQIREGCAGLISCSFLLIYSLSLYLLQCRCKQAFQLQVV